MIRHWQYYRFNSPGKEQKEISKDNVSIMKDIHRFLISISLIYTNYSLPRQSYHQREQKNSFTTLAVTAMVSIASRYLQIGVGSLTRKLFKFRFFSFPRLVAKHRQTDKYALLLTFSKRKDRKKWNHIFLNAICSKPDSRGSAVILSR